MLPNHGRRTHKSQVTLRANFAGISLFSSLGSFHTITVAQIPRIDCVCVPSGTFFTVSIPCIHRCLNSHKSAQTLSRASATPTLPTFNSSSTSFTMPSILKTVAAIAVLATAVTGQSDTTPVTGKLGNATIQSNNPAGVAYIATLTPNSKSNIAGNVLALTSSDNTGVNFQIALTGLPSEGGPFCMLHTPQICISRIAN